MAIFRRKVSMVRDYYIVEIDIYDPVFYIKDVPYCPPRQDDIVDDALEDTPTFTLHKTEAKEFSSIGEAKEAISFCEEFYRKNATIYPVREEITIGDPITLERWDEEIS